MWTASGITMIVFSMNTDAKRKEKPHPVYQTERGKENKGYSASIFCNQVGPEGGRDLVEATLEALNDFADPKE